MGSHCTPDQVPVPLSEVQREKRKSARRKRQRRDLICRSIFTVQEFHWSILINLRHFKVIWTKKWCWFTVAPAAMWKHFPSFKMFTSSRSWLMSKIIFICLCKRKVIYCRYTINIYLVLLSWQKIGFKQYRAWPLVEVGHPVMTSRVWDLLF